MTRPSRPPRVALWLADTLLPLESRDVVVGDLVESHDAISTTHPFRARLRFWREALAAIVQLQLLPPLVSAFTPHQRESLVQSFLSDIRHAVRILARSPRFTALCLGTLGIAIGATATIYSVVNPVLLRALPYPGADRVVHVGERDTDGSLSRLGYLTFRDLRDNSRTLEHAAAVGFWEPIIFGERDAERVRGQVVSWEFFRTLGVRPLLGRDFDRADDKNPGEVVIIGHGFWTRRFGGDPEIVGQAINTNGRTRRIIGVMPASFDNVLDPLAAIWLPLGYSEADNYACRSCRHLQMIARMRAGVTFEQTSQEMDALLARAAAAHPKEYPGMGVSMLGLQDSVTRNARPILLALMGAALLVLLIAAANVANFQLARAIRRREEFAVRAVLGAGRGRIARQLLAEGLVLATFGAITGILVALVALPTIVALLPEDLPRLAAMRLDWRVLVTVAATAMVVGVAIGITPAFTAGGSRLFEAIRGGGRSLIGARRRVRAALVVVEIGLALMLVIGAGLLARSLQRLMDVDLGFDPTHLLTLEVHATGSAYRVKESVFANHDRIREVVGEIPGVVEVGLTTQLPLGGSFDRYGVVAMDKPLENPELAPSADRYVVSGDLLAALRIPIVRGRKFTQAEAADSNGQIAIVSQALAKRIWGSEDPIGKQIRLGGPSRPWKQVIGVAANVRHTGLDDAAMQQVYIPERQWYWEDRQMALVVRTSGDPERLAGAVREAVRSVDPIQPIAKLATMDAVISRSTSQRRLGLVLFVTFGGIALLLAAAGIYGVLAGSVEERTREFGLRSAMGATPSSIVGLVLRQAGRLALTGFVLGIVGALLLSRYIESLLYGIEASDPFTVVFATAALTTAALGACLVPALRAVRVDPIKALSSD